MDFGYCLKTRNRLLKLVSFRRSRDFDHGRFDGDCNLFYAQCVAATVWIVTRKQHRPIDLLGFDLLWESIIILISSQAHPQEWILPWYKSAKGNHVMHQETKQDWCQFLTRNCLYIVKVEGNHVMHQETKRDRCQFLTRNYRVVYSWSWRQLYNASRNQAWWIV